MGSGMLQWEQLSPYSETDWDSMLAVSFDNTETLNMLNKNKNVHLLGLVIALSKMHNI